MCSIFLGTGTMFVWIGVIRYMGYFRKYNVRPSSRGGGAIYYIFKGMNPNIFRSLTKYVSTFRF